MPTRILSAKGCIRSTSTRGALIALGSLWLAACIDTRVEGGAAGSGNTAGGGSAAGGAAGSAGQIGGSAGSGGLAPSGATGSGGQGGQQSSGGQAGAGSGGAAGHGDGGASAGSAGMPGEGGGSGGVSHVPRLGGALKIMPLGDSITASGCYRARLAELLDAEHPGDYDFVGSQDGDSGCGYTYDTDHEGHGGFLVTQHTNDIAGWAAANPTDVVLLHFATNDVWNNVPPDEILDSYSAAVDEFRKHNANVVILVAQIIPLAPEGCGHCDVRPLNEAIPGWAAEKASADSPIIVVDQFSDYSAMNDSDDRVHPNASGAVKIATRWAAALDPLF